MSDLPAPDRSVMAFAAELGFGRAAQWSALGGGVSCEVWKVTQAGRSAVIKRALARLKVADEWLAPVRRNATEWAWFETAGRIAASAVPPLLAHDPGRGLFAMGYLPWPLWKAELLDGGVDIAFAATVGRVLVRLHAASAGDAAIAMRFATDADFHALRLEPYLLATARRHPLAAEALASLVRHTAATRRALVHGDVSPKNILKGPDGPVFLDAETAWYGDPAFDLAFCLNHLMLKALLRPQGAEALERAFNTLAAAYLSGVTWEPAEAVESRAAALLPGLLLARADGKSPVEYLDEARRAPIRGFAPALIVAPPPRLSTVYAAWRRALA